MSGMGANRKGVNESLIVSAFHHSLSTQAQVLVVAFVVVAVLLVVGRLIVALLANPRVEDVPGKGEGGERGRGWDGEGEPDRVVAPPLQPAFEALSHAIVPPARVAPKPPAHTTAPPARPAPEPLARRVLRIGFGVLWLLDGALQIQSHMPLGLPENVVAPSVQGSPAWLVSTVHWGLRVWENHPVQAAVAAVWIQLGLGLWLLLVVRGRWSRLGGAVSIGWALSVWVFGESMGGILAPGASWLFGAPGAVLFYALAGGLLALPERAWRDPRLGRRLLVGFGVYFIAMAVLQAWPGNGFWARGSSGALPAMVSEMAATPQPHAIARVVGHFGSFAAGHAVLVNVFVVAALGVIGLALLSGRRRPTQAAVGAAAVLCLADWVLVQDFGVFGGVGTDPNSMAPTLLVLCASYLALVRPALATAPARAPAAAGRAGRQGLRPAVGVLAVVAACATTALGAVPYAIAAVEPNATTLLAESIDGPATAVPGDVPPSRRAAARTARPADHLRKAPREGAAGDVSRPGVHHRLPRHRPGVQAG